MLRSKYKKKIWLDTVLSRTWYDTQIYTNDINDEAMNHRGSQSRTRGARGARGAPRICHGNFHSSAFSVDPPATSGALRALDCHGQAFGPCPCPSAQTQHPTSHDIENRQRKEHAEALWTAWFQVHELFLDRVLRLTAWWTLPLGTACLHAPQMWQRRDRLLKTSPCAPAKSFRTNVEVVEGSLNTQDGDFSFYQMSQVCKAVPRLDEKCKTTSEIVLGLAEQGQKETTAIVIAGK